MRRLLMRGGVVLWGMVSGYMSANTREFPVVQVTICLLAIAVFAVVEVIVRKEKEIEKWK